MRKRQVLAAGFRKEPQRGQGFLEDLQCTGVKDAASPPRTEKSAGIFFSFFLDSGFVEEFLRTKVCTRSVTGATKTVYEEGWRVGTGDISTYIISKYTLQRLGRGLSG